MPSTLFGSVLIDLAIGAGLGFSIVMVAEKGFPDDSAVQKAFGYCGRGVFFTVILYHIVARSVNSALG